MNKKRIFIRGIALSLFVILVLQTNVFAARTVLTLPKNQAWVTQSTTRTGNFNDLHARCYSVYPTSGGTDNYKKIQVRATNSSGTVITSTETLVETASTATSLAIRNGYLGISTVKFQFRGNDPALSAYADVYYHGR